MPLPLNKAQLLLVIMQPQLEQALLHLVLMPTQEITQIQKLSVAIQVHQVTMLQHLVLIHLQMQRMLQHLVL